MKETIEDLREHLFATLKALRDTEKPMEIERAKAIAQVAQVVVDSARAENEFTRLTGKRGSAFIPEALPAPGTPEHPRLVKGAASR